MKVTGLVLAGALLAGAASAQERPAPAVEVAIGSVGFADDGIVWESLFGGAGRFYLSPRISVGPELGYIAGTNHSHLMLTGNLTCDLLSPSAAGPRRVTPFIVAGGGLFQTRESFFGRSFNSTEGAFTVGGGARANVGERAFVGIDARIGWEAHFRVNALVGFRIG